MIRRRLPAAVAAALLVALVPVSVSTAASAPAPIVGAGSPFAEVALDQWSSDVYINDGLSVDYRGTGQALGRQQFLGHAVDFAAGELPFTPAELESSPRPFTYVPLVGSGIAFAFHVLNGQGQRLNDLVLRPTTACRLFLDPEIRWDDAELVADNPALAAVTTPVRPVVPNLEASSSAVLADFCRREAADVWATSVGDPTVPLRTWPSRSNQLRLAGSNEQANLVAAPIGVGTITFVETVYALQLALPLAVVENAAGQLRLPTSGNVTAALASATRGPDGTYRLEVSPSDPLAYPIAAITHAIVPTAGLDVAKAVTLREYLTFAVGDGQEYVHVLGYAPLAQPVIEAARDEIAKIPTPEPVVSPSLEGTSGRDGWFTSDVTLGWVVDSGSVHDERRGCEINVLRTDTAGTDYTCTVANAAGETSATVTVRRDATPPVLAPSVGPAPVLLRSEATASPGASDATSGVLDADCETPSTNEVGPATTTCHATDVAGNLATATVPYRVEYGFRSYVLPFDGTAQRRTAGRPILALWSVYDAAGRPVAVDPGAFTVTTQACAGGTPGPIPPPDATGIRALPLGLYLLHWPTRKRDAGTCSVVTLDLGDGVAHTATVLLTR